MALQKHTAKKEKKKTKNKKSRYSISAIAATVHQPQIQHLNCRLSKNNAFKKGAVHKHHRRPIKDLKFSPSR
jgi:hypothetical protein